MVVATLAVVCGFGQAQPPVSEQLPDLDEPLTLQQCIDLALQRHPDVGTARASAVAARANARAQRSLCYPQLQAQWSARETQSLDADDRRTTRSAAVALDYTLYQSGLNARIERAETTAEASQYSIADTRRQLTYAVSASYWTILASHRYAEVTMDAMANAQRHWELVRARIDAGLAPESDILPVNVQVAQARLDAVRADTELSVAYAEMRALLGLPPQARFRLAEGLVRQARVGDLDTLLQAAEQNRPDLASQRLAVRAADLGVEIARAETGVRVSAGASADYGRHTGTTGESWQLYVGATYPLFDAGASEAQRTGARADSDGARWRMASMMQNIHREVESAYLRMSQAEASVEAAETTLAEAQSSLAAAEARYVEGLAIVVEVTDAQLALLRAQVGLVQAEYDYALVVAALDRAVGIQAATMAGDGQ